MGKWQNDAMLDAALSYVQTNSAQIVLCQDIPSSTTAALTDYDGGGTNVGLGEKVLVSGTYTGPDNDTSGRKLTVPEVTAVDVDVTGTVNNIAIIGSSDVLYVTSCVAQNVTAGNTVTIPEWDINVLDVGGYEE